MLETLATRIFGSIYTDMKKESKSIVTLAVGVLGFIVIFAFLAYKKDFIEDALLLLGAILLFIPKSRVVLKGLIPSSAEEVKIPEKLGSLKEEDH
jgi:hypothetical protein